MRLERALVLKLFDDDLGEGPSLLNDLDQLSISEDESTASPVVGEVAMGRIVVPATPGTIQLPFGSLTTAFTVMVAPDGDVDLVLNGGEALRIRAPSGGGRGLFLLEGEVTSAVLEGVGASTVNALFALVGV